MCSSPGEDCTGDQANALWSRVPDVEVESPLECAAIILRSRATGKKVPGSFEAGCRSPQRNNCDPLALAGY
jgi:hypothetical protein